MPSKSIIIKLLSAPYKGKELKYHPKDVDPESVFTRLALIRLDWKTIYPQNMDSVLQKKWEVDEILVREASKVVFFSEEEEMEEF